MNHQRVALKVNRKRNTFFKSRSGESPEGKINPDLVFAALRVQPRRGAKLRTRHGLGSPCHQRASCDMSFPAHDVPARTPEPQAQINNRVSENLFRNPLAESDCLFRRREVLEYTHGTDWKPVLQMERNTKCHV
jgi:hypothetical protein